MRQVVQGLIRLKVYATGGKTNTKQKSRLKLKLAKCLRDEKVPKLDMLEIDADA